MTSRWGSIKPSPDSSAASKSVFIFLVCNERSRSCQSDTCKEVEIGLQNVISITMLHLLPHHEFVIWCCNLEGLLPGGISHLNWIVSKVYDANSSTLRLHHFFGSKAHKHTVDDAHSCKANNQLVGHGKNGIIFLQPHDYHQCKNREIGVNFVEWELLPWPELQGNTSNLLPSPKL